MRGDFSDLDAHDLRWLKAVVMAHVAASSALLRAAVLRWTGDAPNALGPVVQLASSFAIFLAGCVAPGQPQLLQMASASRFAEDFGPPREPPPSGRAPTGAVGPESPPAKYQRNRLDHAEAEELVAKLHALMTDAKLYRDAGLNLPTLADSLRVTPHKLSQVLSMHVGKSFAVLVNAYRAEALKEALADPSLSGRAVLELAFDVGFRSKSTLNSSFKKHTGMTPTEFRDRVHSLKIP